MTTSKYVDSLRANVCLALAACIALTLTGCVLVPVPTAVADPEPFTQASLAGIRVGHTTRDEVRTLFAGWTYTTDDGVQTAHIDPQIFDDGRYWVFALPRQIGDIAFAGLVLYFPVILPVLIEKGDNYKNYWVLVEFDETGTVGAFWIANETAPCKRGSVCYRNGHLLVLANDIENEPDASKVPNGDRCVVYTYARTDFDTPVTVADGLGLRADRVFGKTSFLRTEISPGQSTISASIEGSTATASDVSVTCMDSETIYVALDRIKESLAATVAGSSAGAHEVAKRFGVEHAIPVSVARPAPHVEDYELNTGLVASVHFAPAETGSSTAAVDTYLRAMELVATRSPDAWPLLCKAADLGHTAAQMELGYWQRADFQVPNEFAEPLEKDNRLAFVWYRLAELNGGDVTSARQYVGDQLTDEERSQANVMVRDWRPGACPLRLNRP